MIVWNTSNKVIFITTEYEVNPDGSQATPKTTYSVAPGESVDLAIVGLEVEKTINT